jgi:hypothetical protein
MKTRYNEPAQAMSKSSERMNSIGCTLNARIGHFFVFLTLLVGSWNPVFSQVTIESRVDRSKILIGDVITYSVIITHAADVKLERPSPGKNLGQFEIRDYKVQEPTRVGEQIVSRTDYQISTFDVGDYEIPSLQVYYRTKQDTTLHELKTEVLKIHVASLNPNEKGDIRDIKPPLTPPRQWGRIIAAVSAVVALLALAGLAYWYWRRRRLGKSILPTREKPPRPPHETALEALAALNESDLLATGQIKAFYTQLSEILRQYVGGRYFIDAMEMTTRQLTDRMTAERIDPDHIQHLQGVLDVSDLVKFAKFIPPETLQQRAVPEAIAFVDKTKLVLSEPTEPAAVEVPAVAEKEA